MILKQFLRFLLLSLSMDYSISEQQSGAIEYELAVTTPEYTYEKSIRNEDVVTSKDNAFSITILSDIPVLRKGMLQITPETYYFWMDGRNLAEIEPGAFDNQNITEEIRLESNKLTAIKTGSFKNLQIKKLDLSYNHITHIEASAISDLPNLWEVHLSRNRIKDFNENCFANTPKLSSFVISYNNLTKLGANWFRFMKKEEPVIVAAGYNQIEEIDRQTFAGINVWNLILDHNKLKDIPVEVFTNNDIKLLNLEDNQLESLPDGFFEQKVLGTANLTNNPLRCDVQQKLQEFSEKTGAIIFFDNKKC